MNQEPLANEIQFLLLLYVNTMMDVTIIVVMVNNQKLSMNWINKKSLVGFSKK